MFLIGAAKLTLKLEAEKKSGDEASIADQVIEEELSVNEESSNNSSQ